MGTSVTHSRRATATKMVRAFDELGEFVRKACADVILACLLTLVWRC